MDEKLFKKATRIHQDVKRNIVYTPEPKTAFASLIDDKDDLSIIKEVIISARTIIKGENKLSDFYYTCAIEYPFKTEPFISSRFTDGSYPVWYGSTSIETTLFETAYHSARQIQAIEGIEHEKIIIRKRSVYDVFCNAIMIDLVGNEKEFPDLISDHYQLTHQIGKIIYKDNLPGIISTSARHLSGININVFKSEILSHPRKTHTLSYHYSPRKGTIKIFDKDQLLMTWES